MTCDADCAYSLHVTHSRSRDAALHGRQLRRQRRRSRDRSTADRASSATPVTASFSAALRERADAVLAGTGTIAAEDYGRMLRAGRAPRAAAGRRAPAEPLRRDDQPQRHACHSRSRCSQEPEAQVVVFSPTVLRRRPVPATSDPRAAAVGHLALHRRLKTLARAIRRTDAALRGRPDAVRRAAARRLVDELFLTLAPKLVGGRRAGGGQRPPLAAPVAARRSRRCSSATARCSCATGSARARGRGRRPRPSRDGGRARGGRCAVTCSRSSSGSCPKSRISVSRKITIRSWK